jgi:hypothetical protein
VSHRSIIYANINIYYFRPFSPNEKEPNAAAISKIEIESFTELTTDELQLHERCKEIRNKAVAHAEWIYYPTRLHATGVISSRFWNIISDPIDWVAVRSLATQLLKQCNQLRGSFVISGRL